MELLLRPIKRALISVSDKEGIVDFAKALRSRNGSPWGRWGQGHRMRLRVPRGQDLALP